MAETHTNSTVSRLRIAGGKRNRAPAHIAAVDIDGDSLRVAFGTRRGDRMDFSRVATAPLELPADADRSDPAVLGAAVGKALNGLGGKPGTIAMAVPRREAILRTVTLPDLGDDRELASMVQLQVGRDLPFRKEDAVIDFEVRPLSPGDAAQAKASEAEEDSAAPQPDKVEALVAVAQAEIVSFYQKVCDAAGVKLAALTFAPYANARCVGLVAGAASNGTNLNETVALVALRSGEVTVDVIRGGKLLFSRDAALGEEHHEAGPEADEPAGGEPATNGADSAAQLNVVARITIEVVRSLHSFGGMTPGAPVARILVAGGTGQENEVAEGLAKRFNFPATVVDLAAGAGADASAGAPGAIAASITAMGTSAAVTDPEGPAFNFLSPKRPAVQRDMRRLRRLAIAAAVVVLFISVLGVRSYLIKQRLKIQQALQLEITRLQKDAALFRKTRAQASAIQDWKKESRSWLEHYSYLTSILPGSEEIYITSLSVAGQGTIRLAVQARNGEVLAKLDKQLRAAGYEVKPQAITPGVDRYGYDFRTTVELIIPPKLKIDLSKAKTPPPRPPDDNSLNAGPKLHGRLNVPADSGVAVYGGGR